LQTDVAFDPEAIAFVRGQALGRGAEMVFAAALREEGRVRVLLYSEDEAHLPGGDGAVACLTFSIAGETGSECGIVRAATHLSDLDAQPLTFESVDGAVTVLDAEQAPGLCVFGLKNPARPRALAIYAAADQALAAPPEVWVAGQPVAMRLLDPAENIYQGTVLAGSDAESLVVSASATNGTTPAAAQTTIVFEPGGGE
jgi:hypothetical protein